MATGSVVSETSGLRAALLLRAAAMALAFGAPAGAQAQAPTPQELLEQIKLLQKRIDQLEAAEKQRQAAGTKPRAPAVQPSAPPSRPAASEVAVPAAAPPVTEPVPPPPASASAMPAPVSSAVPADHSDQPNGTFMLGAFKLTLGGFFDLTGYYRSRNENRGTGTGYNAIPFNGPNPQGNSGEFGLSAQQTRLSARLEAPAGPQSTLTGYLEFDFNNGAGGANSVQSNSYTPRLRHAFGRYDDDSWQLLAGQTWTLATPFRRGLDPFGTWQPPTIDHNYMVGYTYLRTPLVRAIRKFGGVSIGVEANTPQTVFGGVPAIAPGEAVFTGYAGGSGLNPQATYSVNVAPDLVAKIAVDTTFGHFDVFGVARWFRDQSTYGTTSVNHDAFGGGVGASAFVHIGDRVDLMGNVLYGSGIGRYGAAGLPDVTYLPNGGVTTLPQGMGSVGALVHAIPKVLDLYGYYGWAWVGASYFPGGGYGNPAFDNNGCFNPNALGVGCAGNTQTLTEWTVGLNWHMVSGRFGSLRSGLQYSNIVRTAYAGQGGMPRAAENLFMFNLRYSPFN